MSDPEKVVVAGDWHGNRRWALDVIGRSRALLAGEDLRAIVHLGDFGFWPYKVKDWGEGEMKPAALQYLLDIQSALEVTGAWLMVTPGNHDDYDAMERWTEPGYPEYATFSPDTPYGRLRRIQVLPRGHRWTWHGRTWLSVGGAVSVDRRLPPPGRVIHESWWPQEEVTDEQAGAIIAGGPADVMVCHDSPAMVPVPGDHHMEPWFAPEDMERARAHGRRMQRIVEGVHPAYYMHGHHHRRYQRQIGTDWGGLRVDGMDMDGERGNFAVLNVRTMDWE